MKKKDLLILRDKLLEINAFMLSAETEFGAFIQQGSPGNRKRAANLIHYLVLRSLDIRKLQDKLHAAGLSSLASSESHVRFQLLSILERLGKRINARDNLYDYKNGRKSIKKNSALLFGRGKDDKIPSIMVTLDGSVAVDYSYIRKMIESGMTIARINCAHDDEDTWLKMIRNIRRASRATGLNCKIYMDLAGPKLRTVYLEKGKVKVKVGETIFLTDETHLKKSVHKTIGCTIPDITNQLKEGERVLFDDGLIEARVEKIEKKKAHLRVTRISSKKNSIKKEKGINFPDSMLSLSAITTYDKKCLPFILKHADMVGCSFVRNVDDLKELRKEMKGRKKDLIIKVETSAAVRNFPSLLFYGMSDGNFGVMIARGDLAIEIGFERMSEIQEEILWICEAAHVPVIWATQVLQTLNKSGIATRSEITDAAHAAQADCVMINKGQHILKVLDTLKDISHRTGGHHVKKRFTFRPLKIASDFILEHNVN